MKAREAYEWRYTRRGHVRHALRHTIDAAAICGVTVNDWYGTGSQAEYEQAAALPDCRRCARRIGGVS